METTIFVRRSPVCKRSLHQLQRSSWPRLAPHSAQGQLVEPCWTTPHCKWFGRKSLWICMCIILYIRVCVCVSVWAYAFAKLTASQQTPVFNICVCRFTLEKEPIQENSTDQFKLTHWVWLGIWKPNYLCSGWQYDYFEMPCVIFQLVLQGPPCL